MSAFKAKLWVMKNPKSAKVIYHSLLIGIAAFIVFAVIPWFQGGMKPLVGPQEHVLEDGTRCVSYSRGVSCDFNSKK